MEALTTIGKMFSNNHLFVPRYQRSYSWDTEIDTKKPHLQKHHVNVFLSDLKEYKKTASTYYFGHFLFEKKTESKFNVIDGQQRLTTIVIFLSALFKRLKKTRDLDENEEIVFEDIIKRKSTYKFETVYYDNQFFRDYVIEQTQKDKNNLKTESAKRIANAFDFFNSQLEGKDESYLQEMLETIQNASCTTHTVQDESQAIQMFLFQNNRGKMPSNLEIIKAQFMFKVHLYCSEGKDNLIQEIRDRFETIYKSISSIEYKIHEDDVLLYTLRVHFNSLGEINSIEKINEQLVKENPIPFIQEFAQSLATSFQNLNAFFVKDEKEHIEIHSLVTLGGIAIALPFIIKAYRFGIGIEKINQLCKTLESIILRDRLIGTRANLNSRLNDVYQNFTDNSTDIQHIIGKVEWMKSVPLDRWWWSYWNNEKLKSVLQGQIYPQTARFLLWKYENHLGKEGNSGYAARRFDTIEKPHLEHIAPQTESDKDIAAGYDNYDEEFKNKYLDCLGNYLLLSGQHNSSIGNKPFLKKWETYTELKQQREVRVWTEDKLQDKQIWTRDIIQKRKEKIIDFLMKNI